MHDMNNFNLPYYTIFCVLGSLCSALFCFFFVLHINIKSTKKRRKESGYENIILGLGCGSIVMFFLLFIA